jgi:hypothetical protein
MLNVAFPGTQFTQTEPLPKSKSRGGQLAHLDAVLVPDDARPRKTL